MLRRDFVEVGVSYAYRIACVHFQLHKSVCMWLVNNTLIKKEYLNYLIFKRGSFVRSNESTNTCISG